MAASQINPGSHGSGSGPSIGFPLGTALVLLVIFSLSGIFSCCYHWDKLRRSFSSHGAGPRVGSTKPTAPSMAKPHIRNSRVDEIVEPGITGSHHAEAIWRVVEVALACIEPYSTYRPYMADIVRELEDAFVIENNASECMKSIESWGSSRYSLQRPFVMPSTTVTTEVSPMPMQPPPPQPR